MSEKVAVALRLPEDLHEKVKAWAKQEHRSANAQYIVLLEEKLADQPQPEGSELL